MEEGRRNERKTIYKPVHDARSRHSQVLGRTHRQTAGCSECSVGHTDRRPGARPDRQTPTLIKRYTGARR